MRVLKSTFLILCLAAAPLRAETPQSAARMLLYNAAVAGVTSGTRYDQMVKDGLDNSTNKASALPNTAQKVLNAKVGSFISDTEANDTLNASKPFFSNTPVPGSPAGMFWNGSASASQAQFDNSVSVLSRQQLTDIAKAAPVGDGTQSNALADQARALRATGDYAGAAIKMQQADQASTDGRGKLLQSAAAADEGARGQTARFWALLKQAVDQTTADQNAAAAMGTPDCYGGPPAGGGPCPLSQAGGEIWNEALGVGSAVAEFKTTADANRAAAKMWSKEDAPLVGTGGSSTSTFASISTASPAPDPGAIPASVADALSAAGLDPAEVEARVASGDKSVYSEIAGALDTSGNPEAAADIVRDLASNASSDDAQGSSGGNGRDSGARGSSGLNGVSLAQAAGNNRAAQAAASSARRAGGRSQAAAAQVEAMRRNYQRKHGGKLAGDEDASALSFAAAKAAQARKAAGNALSDVNLLDLRGVGVQKRRDANIFQIARLTYRKQANAQTVRRAQASARAKTALLLAGSVAQ